MSRPRCRLAAHAVAASLSLCLALSAGLAADANRVVVTPAGQPRWDLTLGPYTITRGRNSPLHWAYRFDGKVLASSYHFTEGPRLRAPDLDAIALSEWGGDECAAQPVILVARPGQGVQTLHLRSLSQQTDMWDYCRGWKILAGRTAIIFVNEPTKPTMFGGKRQAARPGEIWRFSADGVLKRTKILPVR